MLRPVAWPLCDPTRGRALSEDIPPERTPWSKTEVVTCVVVERWCGKKGGLKARARRWVPEEESTTSRDGLTEQQTRVTEDTQHINRRKTADR